MRQLIAVGVIVLISRLPFITSDYGNDPDGWRVALAAEHNRENPRYRFSRHPGYPVIEQTAALLLPYGARAINATTAGMSVLAAVAFAGLLRRAGVRDAALCAVAMSFVPVIYTHSTDAMDYVWALAFLLAASWAATADRPLLAGVMLGLGIGTRITTGAMLLPLLIMLCSKGSAGRRLWRGAAMSAIGLAIGVLWFVPIMLSYGKRFFGFVDNSRPGALVLQHATVGVWGDVGTLALLATIVATGVAWALRRRIRPTRPLPARHLVFASAGIVTILLYATAFLRLPHDPGYLIPVVPFVIMLAAMYSPRVVTRGFCVLLCVAPFVSVAAVRFDRDSSRLSIQGRVAAGPVIEDSRIRERRVQLASQLFAFEASLDGPHVIEAGSYLPMISVMRNAAENPHVEYVRDLSPAAREKYQQRGYLPGKVAFGGNPPILVRSGRGGESREQEYSNRATK